LVGPGLDLGQRGVDAGARMLIGVGTFSWLISLLKRQNNIPLSRKASHRCLAY